VLLRRLEQETELVVAEGPHLAPARAWHNNGLSGISGDQPPEQSLPESGVQNAVGLSNTSVGEAALQQGRVRFLDCRRSDRVEPRLAEVREKAANI
jgi:hypothetical protein